MISTGVNIIGPNSIDLGAQIIPSIQLRQYLMYWDKIDLPNNPIITSPETEEMTYLREVGFLERSKIDRPLAGEFVDMFLKSQMWAFNKKNEVDPASWSLAQPTSHLILAKDESIMTRSLEIELYNCLPVPSEESSLDDILKFKDKRRDELLELRMLMDNFQDEIHTSLDSERKKEIVMRNLEKKLKDLDTVMQESYIKRVYRSVKLNVEPKKQLTQALATFGAAGSTGLPLEISALAGFTSSFIKVDYNELLRPKSLPENLNNYAYLYYQKKEI